MKAAAYIRVSSQAQAKADKYGLDIQREDVNRWAEANGVEIVGWYEDDGVSGTLIDRPGIVALMEDAGTGQFTTVVVPNWERLGRDMLVSLTIQDELKKCGVNLVSVAEPEVDDSPAAKFMRNVFQANAQFHKEMLVLKLTKARRMKAKRGGFAGHRAPLGYVAKGAALEVDPRGSAAVRRLFEIKNHRPGWSLRKVAAQLNDEGYQTTEGGKFYAQTVKRVLGRESLYTGAYQYAGIKANGQHTAIL